MGFGSYDESEQKDADVETDESAGLNIHDKDHDGEVAFDSDVSTDEMLDKLDDIKDDD
ncbi:MAG: DUF5786 family protein [Natronomonas sp.]